MTRPNAPVGLTVGDGKGRSLVVERWGDGTVSAWIADVDQNDGVSVSLTDDARRRVAAFLLEGLR